jgi:hypothetical protein
MQESVRMRSTGGKYSVQGHNLRSLCKTFRTKPVKRAISLLRECPASDLHWLLRHHDQEEITDAETWDRDDVDYALAYFGMLELGIVFSALPEKLPVEVAAEARDFLSHPAVIPYYRYHYPLFLPQMLLARLSRRGNDVGSLFVWDNMTRKYFDVLSGNAANEGYRVYSQLIPLQSFAESDDDLETFLWYLDGGARYANGHWSDIQFVHRVVKNPKRFFAHMKVAARNRDYHDHAIHGCMKFISYAMDVDFMLSGIENPLVRALTYLQVQYWFNQFESHAREEVHAILKAFSSWQVKDKRAAFAARRYRSKALRAINRLTRNVYARPLKIRHCD